jgi:hypothetical protein
MYFNKICFSCVTVYMMNLYFFERTCKILFEFNVMWGL